MKHVKTFLFPLLLIVLLIAFSSCEQVPTPAPDPDPVPEIEPVSSTEGLAYEVNEDGKTATITGIGNCYKSCICIGTEIDGYTVTAIADYAFSNCTRNFDEVFISDTVTSIGNFAFTDCEKLSLVTIGNGVTYFGDYVFEDCPLIQYNRYDNAFYLGNQTNPYLVLVKAASHSVSTCTIHEDTRFIHSAAFGTYTSGMIYKGMYCPLTSIVIPDKVVRIGAHAFADNGLLTEVVIGKGTQEIGSYAFLGCEKLKKLTLGEQVSCVGYRAFSTGEQLAVTEYENAKYLGNDRNPYYVFLGLIDEAVSDVTIHKDTKIIYSDAFNGCKNLTAISIPDGITNIGGDAFLACESLVAISIPDSVLFFNASFDRCTSLTSVTFGSGVTKLDGGMFEYCENLTTLVVSPDNPVYHSAGNCIIETASKTLVTGANGCVIPDDGSVTSIGDRAFSYHTGLVSLVVPDSVTYLGYGVFVRCTNLKHLTLSHNIEDYDSFLEMGDFHNLTFNQYDNAYYIGDEHNPYLFLVKAVNEEITSCVIHEDTRFIGDSAFLYCKKLTHVTMGKNVRKISSLAFWGCESLISIYIPANVTYVSSIAFAYTPALEHITVAAENKVYWGRDNCLIERATKTLVLGCKNSIIPNYGEVVTIGYGAFMGCSDMTSLDIPAYVEGIDKNAFEDCTELTDLTIGGRLRTVDFQAFTGCENIQTITYRGSISTIRSYLGYGWWLRADVIHCSDGDIYPD